jgi:uncharacterized membrane protein YkvA (DUF1232 family)
MYKPHLSKPGREILVELLQLMANENDAISIQKSEMFQSLIEAYNMNEYNAEGLSEEDLQFELEDLKEKDVLHILTLATLFALVDGTLNTFERHLIRRYFSLLSLDSASKMQSLLDKHATNFFDVRDLYDINKEPDVVFDESLEIMHDFTNKSEDDIDEGLLMKMQRGPVKKVWTQVMKLYGVVRDPKSDKAIKALGIGALLYLISPIDAIPDMIPIIGLTDDVGIIAYVMAQLTKSRQK